ncbi:MAG: PqqD family peptide modification chaperone [Syntrophomonadaceae bacterium]|nr:PqqD family peptide modification chaperone [Syntrophomonadaceae bacterium]
MENVITNDMIFGVVEGVKTRRENFGLLVVSKTTPALSLNEDAMSVWELCNGINTVDVIIKAIQDSCQSEGIDKLVMKTLDSFLKLGLIKRIG